MTLDSVGVTIDRPVYLFLDIDGVLHPETSDITGYFVHADRLGRLLKHYPNVRVVISSSWREIHPLDTLRGFCGSVVGPRVVGATPIHLRRRDFIDPKPRVRLRLDGHAAIARLRFRSNEEHFHERFEEIALWLAVHTTGSTGATSISDHALGRDDWITLDDSASWFPPGCSQLSTIDGGQGLNETQLKMLDSRLAAMQVAVDPVSWDRI